MLKRLLILPAAAAVLAGAGAAAAGGASAEAGPRACTAQDLEGTRAPAMLRGHGLDTQDGPLVAGTRYRVVAVQELAIGDNARPVDGSVSISAPAGPALSAADEDGRPAYDFRPARAGKVTLVVSWQEEVGDYGSGDICQASQPFDLPVLEPTAPSLVGRFHRGSSAFGSSFTLGLKGKRPQDPAKVTVLLRARRGSLDAPAPRGPAFARYTFEPTGSGGFVGRGATRALRHTFYSDLHGGGVRIYPYPNIAFGRPLRFAFSLEVLQHGKRVGGMSSGAQCRRIQFRGHSAVKCKAVGLKQAP